MLRGYRKGVGATYAFMEQIKRFSLEGCCPTVTFTRVELSYEPFTGLP